MTKSNLIFYPAFEQKNHFNYNARMKHRVQEKGNGVLDVIWFFLCLLQYCDIEKNVEILKILKQKFAQSTIIH